MPRSFRVQLAVRFALTMLASSPASGWPKTGSCGHPAPDLTRPCCTSRSRGAGGRVMTGSDFAFQRGRLPCPAPVCRLGLTRSPRCGTAGGPWCAAAEPGRAISVPVPAMAQARAGSPASRTHRWEGARYRRSSPAAFSRRDARSFFYFLFFPAGHRPLAPVDAVLWASRASPCCSAWRAARGVRRRVRLRPARDLPAQQIAAQAGRSRRAPSRRRIPPTRRWRSTRRLGPC